MDKFIFISGMEKCGTTALAAWLVEQGIAEYLVRNVKEPSIYARNDFSAISIGTGSSENLYRLDATVSYALDPRAISRMPEYRTKIILCFRNHWERTWSSYKMKKIMKLHNEDWREFIQNSMPSGQTSSKVMNHMHHRKKIQDKIDTHFVNEGNKLLNSTFLSRLNYEMDFYFSRGVFPFQSILFGSRYRCALGNIFEKYTTEDILCVSLDALRDKVTRNKFLFALTGENMESGPIEEKFSTRLFEFEEKPDFSHRKYDFLRSMFRYDLEQFQIFLESNKINTEFILMEKLKENIY